VEGDVDNVRVEIDKGDSKGREEMERMNTNPHKTRKWVGIAIIGVLVLAGAGLALRRVESGYWAPVGKTFRQITFQSPTEAGAALLNATKSGDQTTLSKILGPDTLPRLLSDDAESNKAAMDAFASKYQQMNRWVDLRDGSRVLYIGADNFAFPVPLAKNPSGQWYFDAVAGTEEIRARDIGRNELLAIDACSALAKAQDVYFKNSGASREYAQHIISTPGRHDGLYWPASESEAPGPLGDLSQFPKSSLPSPLLADPLVMDGYALRVLTAQGDSVPGGAKSYIVNGRMSGGFAILATPVRYKETGIMTFMIGRDGIVYEQDLGPDTAKRAPSIERYNPDQTWSPVE
jgi:Protein of unknown function (DUF2950)